jgi:hypothetical protein
MIKRIKSVMLQDKKKTQTAEGLVDDLEPYRRLIELQKQMIELVRQHERTRRECTVLREQLLKEMTRPRRSRRSLRRGIKRLTGNWLKGLTASWKSRGESRPEPNGSFFPPNHLLKIGQPKSHAMARRSSTHPPAGPPLSAIRTETGF